MSDHPHLPTANAVYQPIGKELRMALNRDETTLNDVVGILGFARRVDNSPNGQLQFTVDGYCASDQDHTYWIYETNVTFL